MRKLDCKDERFNYSLFSGPHIDVKRQAASGKRDKTGMHHILPLGIALLVLAGRSKKLASETAPSQSITETNASNALVAEAVKAASDQYGPNHGVKAEVVSHNPSKTDRTVCGHTNDGEEWVYKRVSDDKIILLTKVDMLF